LDDYLGHFEARLDNILTTLGEFVGYESPSTDKTACDRLSVWLGQQLEEAGAAVELVNQEDYGRHIVGRWGDGSGHILILGHYDTVWPLGEVARRPFRIEGDKAYGPGALDMKVGATQLLYALRGLREMGVDGKNRVTVLFNSDEEVGSPTSRQLIESMARTADCVFVLESGALPNGDLKTFRKGVGMFHVVVEGKASHAGARPEEGVSAIEELARLILRLHAMTDYETGTTVNVGVVEGGMRSNIVAERATADVDLRVTTTEKAAELETGILGLTPDDKRIKLTITGGINRPPMERTNAVANLFSRARNVALQLGFDVGEVGSGGGSDANFTAALGVPTLDGLGGVGTGAHAKGEYLFVSKIPERTAFLAKLIAELDVTSI